MTDPRQHEEALDRLLRQALRTLPERAAPLTLQSRVLRELQRRAALPWWRRGFAHWPLSVRCAFILVCCALVGMTLLDGAWKIAGIRALNDVGAMPFSWVYPVVAAAAEIPTLLTRAIPPTWLYAGLWIGLLLYVSLFGLAAAAYHMLYLQPQNGR
jgi:hypothetical protein